MVPFIGFAEAFVLSSFRRAGGAVAADSTRR
jgi:hypothetical protein